jgi:hypothetical protein
MSTVETRHTGGGLLPHRELVIGLGLFSAICAMGGGIQLIVAREGNQFAPLELIEHTPFRTFLVPGFLLGGVVGGASLACAALAWRRSRAAIDATIVAGGALTVWIVAEAAMFRSIHGLHLLFGALGLSILSLGMSAAWRSGLLRHRWVGRVALAEAIGFLAPMLAGVLSSKANLREVPQGAVVVVAGFVEGLALGAGQAWAWPLPVRRFRYAMLSALGAGIVWAGVMSLRQLVGREGVAPPVAVAASACAALAGLAAIGSAQWIELRHHTPRASRWIAWTALAWAIALPLSFVPAPFVDESTPIASHVVLWGCAGLLMAYVMALITWQGVLRLSQAGEEHSSRSSVPPASRAVAPCTRCSSAAVTASGP